MELQEAKKLAEKFVNRKYNVPNDVLVILDDKTIEKEYGWYFFSTSKRFLETKNWKDMVAGNGIVLVEKLGGQIIQFGTAYSADHYIEEYERGFKEFFN